MLCCVYVFYIDYVWGRTYLTSFVKIDHVKILRNVCLLFCFGISLRCFSVGAGALAYFGAGRGTHYMYFGEVN